MQAEVEIGQQRSARQFAADTLNPSHMITLVFFRVVRKMIVVSEKLCLRLKTIISTVCMCGLKVQLNVIFARIRNLHRIWFGPLFPLKKPLNVLILHYRVYHLHLYQQGGGPLLQLRI